MRKHGLGLRGKLGCQVEHGLGDCPVVGVRALIAGCVKVHPAIDVINQPRLGGQENDGPVELPVEPPAPLPVGPLEEISLADAGARKVVENTLNLTAAHKSTEDGKAESFSFSRSVAVPESVQADKVAAQYQDGVLTVTLPKKEEAKPRKVAVSVS